MRRWAVQSHVNGSGTKLGRKLSIAIVSAALLVPGLSHEGWLLPCTACRFVRYFAAAQTPEMKASLYEKIVYSLVLASSKQPTSTRS